MLDVEELGIESVDFKEATTLTGIKELLRKGDGVYIAANHLKGICYSKSKAKLYLIEGFSDEENLEELDEDELDIEEVTTDEADILIEEYLAVIKNENERRKKYDDWLLK